LPCMSDYADGSKKFNQFCEKDVNTFFS